METRRQMRREMEHKRSYKATFAAHAGLIDRWSEGPITFARQPAREVPVARLVDLDHLAFSGRYFGQYDVGYGQRGQLVTARTRRMLVGYSLCVPPDEDDGSTAWHLDTIGVVPTRQGEGLGTRLASLSAKWAADAGAQVIFTTMWCGPGLERRTRWIAQMGFRATGGDGYEIDARVLAASMPEAG